MTPNLRIKGPLLLWRQEQIIPQLRFGFLGRERDGGDRGRGVKKGREKRKMSWRGKEKDRIIFHTGENI